MTAPFWAAALTMVVASSVLLWAGSRRHGGEVRQPNLGAFDEAVAALHAERAAGTLDTAGHRDAVAELQRRLLAEEAGPLARQITRTRAPFGLHAALAVALPVFAAAGYLALGNPGALQIVATQAPPEISQDDLRPMVDLLAKSLASRPTGQAQDLPGWIMLARSQASLQRFGDAAVSYERAVALSPDDAQLLADLADVLTMVQTPGATVPAAAPGPAKAAVADRTALLLDRALALDPNNLKALALAGNAAFERRDVAKAVHFWQRARAIAPAGSDFANGLDRTLAAAGARVPEASTSRTTATATAASPVSATGTSTGRSLVGDVRIAPSLAGRIAPGDTLFVFARAAQGPRMPLAILRRPATGTQESFTLDDSMAMSPELRLSNFDAVVVGARISRSGNAMPQAGDLVGETRADAASGRLEIVIDRVQP